MMAVSKPVVDRSLPLVARLPLRCWQRLRLPGPIRRDALLQLSAIATEWAIATAEPEEGAAPKAVHPSLRGRLGLTSTHWQALAAGVAAGDALALLCVGRSLFSGGERGAEPATDPGLSALRLAVYYGNRDERLIAASELLLTLPQLLDQPVMSPGRPQRVLAVRRGRAVVVEQLVYQALLGASRRSGPAADVVSDVVSAWVRVTGDAHRRGYPVPAVNLTQLAESQASLLAILQPGSKGEDLDPDDPAHPNYPTSRLPGAGRGPMSSMFSADEWLGINGDPEPDTGTTLVPFPAYSPSWTGGSNKALAARYASLGQPMRLVMAPDRHQAASALDRLAEEMPNFQPAIDRVADHLCLARRLSPSPVLNLPPLLLVGPPGIGKTRFVRRLSEALGVPFVWKGLAGASDNRTLAGTSRGWSSAEPSWPVTQLVQLGVANPILLVDEIEKAGGSTSNGRAHDTMLALLERGTARRYDDDCLGGPIDLSAISWILTANDVSGLPTPLRSRLAVVECGPPLVHQVTALIAGLLLDVAEEYGLPDPRLLPAIPCELLEELRADYARHVDPRRLRRGLVRALAMSAKLEEEAHHGIAPALH